MVGSVLIWPPEFSTAQQTPLTPLCTPPRTGGLHEKSSLGCPNFARKATAGDIQTGNSKGFATAASTAIILILALIGIIAGVYFPRYCNVPLGSGHAYLESPDERANIPKYQGRGLNIIRLHQIVGEVSLMEFGGKAVTVGDASYYIQADETPRVVISKNYGICLA